MLKLNILYLQSLKKDLHTYQATRREVIKQSDDALHQAKRAIFALQRDTVQEAKEKLDAVEKVFFGLNKKYKKMPRIYEEGAYKAALEEFVEASLFYQFVTKGTIGKLSGLVIPMESYLAGLCDVPGELYRYAIKAATNKDIPTVKNCAQMAEDIMGELVEMNLTSYLRTKFDQAKQAVQKLEQVVYEVSK